MAPMLETVKRDSTMLSLIDEEANLPSPMKKQKLYDDEDDGCSDRCDEQILDPKPEPEPELDPEPEWDVDSYDGRECIIHPEERKYCKNEDDYKEHRDWRIKTFNSHGFVEDVFNDVFSIGVTGPPFGSRIPNLVSLCVEKLNKEKGKTVECISIERVNICGGSKMKFFITFMAREHPKGPPVEYQAKAMIYAGNRKPPVPILCRPSLEPTL